MPTGSQGSTKGLPQLSVPGQLLDEAPAMAQAPHLCLYSALPCISGSSPIAPILGVQWSAT